VPSIWQILLLLGIYGIVTAQGGGSAILADATGWISRQLALLGTSIGDAFATALKGLVPHPTTDVTGDPTPNKTQWETIQDLTWWEQLMHYIGTIGMGV